MAIKIVVLGTGRIGRMHAEYLAHRVDEAEVAGVFDVNTEAARAVSEQLGCPLALTLEEALSLEADAVAIATSTDTHVEMMQAAADAGRAIFVEKPISLDLNQVDDALAKIESSGVLVQVGFNRRFDPSHRAVAQAVKAGVVGDVHLCHITSRDPGPPPIEYIKVSGGIFCDMMIHDFDMARYVVGSEVTSVYATGGVLVDPAIGEAGDLDTAVAVLTHENGATTTITNSRKAVYGYDQRVEVFGSEGMVASDNHTDHQTKVATAAGFAGAPLQHFFLERYTQSYLDQWSVFCRSVEAGDQQSEVTGADGRRPLLMGLAAWKSVREGRPVLLTEIA